MNNKGKLIKCECYETSDGWFMRFEYAYKTKRGEYLTVIPKATLPFNPRHPMINSYFGTIDDSPGTTPRLLTESCMFLLPDTIIDPTSGEDLGEHSIKDILIKPYVQKMTKKDIENALGYNIEIIDEEDEK